MDSQRLAECNELASEILKNIELNEIPMKSVVLKCLRLCRLLNDELGVQYFSFESSGYERDQEGKYTALSWKITSFANRNYFDDSTSVTRCFFETIAELETNIEIYKMRLKVAFDPNISITSANPHQHVSTPVGNAKERQINIIAISRYSKKLDAATSAIYKYILNLYNQLRYGNTIESIFTQYRETVNQKLSRLCPEAIEKFVTVYNNLNSDLTEDWANAVHSCRRIIKDVADNLYPPSNEPIIVNGKTVKIDGDRYINRLVQYIDGKSESDTYKSIVGNELEYIGTRLDAINDAVCKGTHSKVAKEEAETYILHTYMLLGDILRIDKD